MPDRTFKVGEDVYDIPSEEYNGFKSQFPDAVEIQSFKVGEDTYDIPLDEVEGFTQNFPEAKSLYADNGEEKESSYVGDVFNAFQAGSARLGQMIAETPGFIFDAFAIPQNFIAEKTGIPIGTSSDQFAESLGIEENQISDYYGEQVDILKENINEKYNKGITEYIGDGEYRNAIKAIGLQVAESAPITIGLMAGNAAGLTAAQSITGGTAVFGAGENAELEELDTDLTQSQKTINSLTKGLAEGVFEQFGITKLGGIYNDLLQKSGKEIADNVVKEGFRDVYLPIASKYLRVGAEEAVSEAGTQFVQNAVTKFGGEDENLDLLDSVADAAIVGLGSSVVLSGPGAVAETLGAGNNTEQNTDEITEEDSQPNNQQENTRTDEVVTPEPTLQEPTPTGEGSSSTDGIATQPVETEVEGPTSGVEEVTTPPSLNDENQTEINETDNVTNEETQVEQPQETQEVQTNEEDQQPITETRAEIETRVKEVIKQVDDTAAEIEKVDIINPLADYNVEKPNRKDGTFTPQQKFVSTLDEGKTIVNALGGLKQELGRAIKASDLPRVIPKETRENLIDQYNNREGLLQERNDLQDQIKLIDEQVNTDSDTNSGNTQPTIENIPNATEVTDTGDTVVPTLQEAEVGVQSPTVSEQRTVIEDQTDPKVQPDTTLEKIGTSSAARAKQIGKFFGKNLPKEEATQLGKISSGILDAVASHFAGIETGPNKWIQSKISHIGSSTPQGVRNAANGRKVKNQVDSYTTTKEATDKVVGNLTSHIDKLINDQEKAIKDNPSNINNDLLQRNVDDLKKIKSDLDKGSKDAKFQNDDVDGQTYRGAVVEGAGNKLMVLALDSPNKSTFLHEMFHIFEDNLTDAQKQALIDNYNEQSGETLENFDTDVSEYSARLWENYWANGKEVNEADIADPKQRSILQEAFDQFSEWLTAIADYVNTKGRSVGLFANDEVNSLFNELIGFGRPAPKVGDTGTELSAGLDANNVYRLNRLTNAEINQVLLDMGRLGLAKTKSESFKMRLQKANRAGYLHKDSTLEIRNQVLDGVTAGDLQQMALMAGMSRLRRSVDEMQGDIDSAQERGEFTDKLFETKERLEQEYELYALAYKKTGTTFGRGLVDRKIASALDFLPEQLKINIRRRFGNVDEKRLTKYDKKVDQIDKKRREYGDKLDKLEEKTNEALTKEATAQLKKSRDIKQTSKDPVKDFKNFFGQVKFSVDDAKNKYEILKNYIKHLIRTEKLTTLGEISNRVLQDFNDIEGDSSPTLDKMDIVKALLLTVKSDRDKKISEYAKNIKKLVSDAKRYSRLEKLINKVLSDKLKPNSDDTFTIMSLIAELQNEQFVDGRGLTNVERESVINSLNIVRDAIDKMMFSGKEISKEYEKDIKKALKILTSDSNIEKLRKKHAQIKAGVIVDTKVKQIRTVLENEALVLKEEIEQGRNDLRIEKKQLEIWSELQKKYGNKRNFLGIKKKTLAYNKKLLLKGSNFFELPRRYMLGLDLSGLFIQGGYQFFRVVGGTPTKLLTSEGRQTLARDYRGLAKAWGEAIRPFRDSLISSEENKQRITDTYNKMLVTENGAYAKQFGLSFNRPFIQGGQALSEEGFGDKGFGDLKADTRIGKFVLSGLKRVDTISEGSYTMLLNVIRLEMFNEFQYANPDHTVEELKDYAKFINNSTGRSNDVQGPLASKIFIAPRLYISRINMLMSSFKYAGRLAKNPKDVVARSILTNNAQYITGLASAMFFFTMLGYDFDEDPRSKTFLKFRKGDSTIDIFSGFGKFINLFAKIPIHTAEFGFGSDPVSKVLGERRFDNDSNKYFDSPSSLLLKTAKYSMHPGIGASLQLFEGQNAIGQPLGTSYDKIGTNLVVNNLLPLWTQDYLFRDSKLDPVESSFDKKVRVAIGDALGAAGINHTNYDNELVNLKVKNHLNDIEINTSRIFTKKHIVERFPVLEKTTFVNDGRIKTLRHEVQNAVGRRILEELNKGNKPSAPQIKGYFNVEAQRLFKIYEEHYGF